ncbi:hypothetical protein RZS08_36220, partial [Arthrospira platensis SPKY1]|nr:hypothetical protein [Arthrospira platensis SPKY1]
MSEGTLSVNVTCGAPPFQYLWSTGQSTQTIENLTSGVYSVTVTDNAGNLAEASTEIVPTIVIPASNPSWANAISNYNLGYTSLENRTIYVEDKLEINSSYTFKNATFEFAEGASMHVKEGFECTITDLNGNRSVLKACGSKWQGITVSGKLLIENSDIFDAYIGISAFSGSNLNIKHANIEGNNGWIGINLSQ